MLNKKNHIALQTMENICDYLNKTNCRAYTKQAGSSEGVVWEREDYVANARLTDLTHDGPIDYVLIEAFPGINASKPFYPLISAYCQENIVPELGAMEVSHEHGDVYFKVEIPIRENAMTDATLRALEDHMTQVIRKHRDAMDALSHGYLPEAMPTPADDEGISVVDPDIIERIERAADGVRGYLMNSNHNVIAEATNDSGLPCWMVEIYTNDEHYYMIVDISPMGFASIKLKYGPKGIRIEKPYRRMTANFLTKESSIRKVGYLWVGSEDEGMCAITSVSLLDGVVGTDTIEEIEGILVKSMRTLRWKVEMLSHGIIPEEDAQDGPGSKLSGLRSMLDDLRARRGASDEDEDEDDEDDGDEDIPIPFDFASFLASLESESEDDDEDEDTAET